MIIPNLTRLCQSLNDNSLMEESPPIENLTPESSLIGEQPPTIPEPPPPQPEQQPPSIPEPPPPSIPQSLSIPQPPIPQPEPPPVYSRTFF